MSTIMTINVCLQCTGIVIVSPSTEFRIEQVWQREQTTKMKTTPNVEAKTNMNYMLASIRSRRASNFIFSHSAIIFFLFSLILSISVCFKVYVLLCLSLVCVFVCLFNQTCCMFQFTRSELRKHKLQT